MTITIKKIAEICGVSRGTVDRVLNDRGKVKVQTEQLVKKVANELGYKPNPAGRALSAKRKKLVVGVLLVADGNPFFDEVIRGIRVAEKEYSVYGMKIELKTMKGYDVEKQCGIMDAMKSEINALILNPISDEKIKDKIDELVEAGIFVVTINNDIENSRRACYVGSNYFNGGETACGIMGLLTQGRAEVGIVTGSFKALGHQQRVEGFKHVMKNKYPNFHIVDYVANDDDDILAFEVTKEMLVKHAQINAIFIVAGGVYGVCRAVLSLGLQNKLTIISFDSVETTVEMLQKQIIQATIYQHPYTQGYKSMDIVFNYLVNGLKPKKTQHILKNEIKILENIN
ncbi:LacI family DNA-binding transcriptional regulator [Anaerosinus massiliensis]|uniref:LacI family DNA-binding transcriptional regulator n=1 Tax=Massilibacillus massiliensis TaxID=1806837 RepID=UPI000B0CD93C|nr:LacI family DNA-binding transcriptional regulator [Massilibacillus massiliensis]